VNKVTCYSLQRARRLCWLHKAREMPKEQFRREVERELTGKETELWENLFQAVQKPDPGDRAGTRNRGLDARK